MGGTRMCVWQRVWCDGDTFQKKIDNRSKTAAYNGAPTQNPRFLVCSNCSTKKRSSMVTNTASLRPLAWLSLALTVYVAGMFALAFGMMSVLMTFTRAIMEDSPVKLARILSIGAATVIPALFLIPFYFAAATRRVRCLHSTLGWVASSIYHGAMTWLLVFHMPASVQPSQMPIPIPVSIFTGTAFLVSIYALIREVAELLFRRRPRPRTL